MDDERAVDALSALAHRHRLRVFRVLVKEGPPGLPAGEIGTRLGIAPSALSFHLAHLERAGLLRSWRHGRQVRYAVEVDRMRGLLAFLTEDCCNGQPEICGGLVAAAESYSETEEADERR